MEWQWQEVVEGLGKAPLGVASCTPYLVLLPLCLAKSKGGAAQGGLQGSSARLAPQGGVWHLQHLLSHRKMWKEKTGAKGIYVPGLSQSSFEIQQHWGNARQGPPHSVPRVLLPAKGSGGPSLWEKPSKLAGSVPQMGTPDGNTPFTQPCRGPEAGAGSLRPLLRCRTGSPRQSNSQPPL